MILFARFYGINYNTPTQTFDGLTAKVITLDDAIDGSIAGGTRHAKVVRRHYRITSLKKSHFQMSLNHSIIEGAPSHILRDFCGPKCLADLGSLEACASLTFNTSSLV